MLRLFWFMGTSCRLQVTGYRVQGTGYRVQGTGYSSAVILWQPENNYNNSEFKVQNSDY